MEIRRWLEPASTAIIIVLSGAAAVQAYRVYGRDNAVLRVAYFELGDTLPPISLDVLVETPGSVKPTALTLETISKQSCTVMIFFESSCPACEALAPHWSKVHTVRSGVQAFAVSWVSVRHQDPNARSFIERHALARPAYAVRSQSDLARIGIGYWPQVVVLGENGVFLGNVARTPDEIAVPEACTQQ